MTQMRQIFVGSFIASFVDKVPDKAWVTGESPPMGDSDSPPASLETQRHGESNSVGVQDGVGGGSIQDKTRWIMRSQQAQL